MPTLWLTAFIDLPAEEFDAATAFWSAATESTLSPARGVEGEFATLLPQDGDAHLRVQRVGTGPGGLHLDVHVDDVEATAARARSLGASLVAEPGGLVVLRSPGGFVFCVVADGGERVRTRPVEGAEPGTRTLVDQVCIDIPPERFDTETSFWEALIGFGFQRSVSHREFSWLVRPPEMPVRLLLQRLDEASPGQTVSAHLDLACDDVAAATAAHQALGARLVGTFPRWVVMEDPSGHRYCLTARDPDTGVGSR